VYLGGRFTFLLVFGSILGIALFEFYRMVEKKMSHVISKAFNIASGGSPFPLGVSLHGGAFARTPCP